MGSSISAALEAQQKAAEEEVKEKMMMMQKLLQNKIQAVTSKLEQQAISDSRLPVAAIVNRSQKLSISVSHSASKEVSGTIDDLFSGKFLDGLKKIVTGGINILLGNASAGEKENTGFCVVYSDNSLLRVDYYMYKYDLTSKGASKDMSNGFLYFVQIGVLDLDKVSPQVVLYELTKSVGTANFAAITKELHNVEAFAKDLYATIREMKQDVLTPKPVEGKSEEEEGKEKGEEKKSDE